MIKYEFTIEDGKVQSVEEEHSTKKEFLYKNAITNKLSDFANEVQNMDGQIEITVDDTGIKEILFEGVDEVHHERVLRILNP